MYTAWRGAWLCRRGTRSRTYLYIVVVWDEKATSGQGYVGKKGWIGVRLDRDVAWSLVAELVEDVADVDRPSE